MALARKRLIKVQNVAFAAQMSFYYLPSLQELEDLKGPKDSLFESKDDFFIVKGQSVFRYLKPGTQPDIVKAENIELNPDAVIAKICLSKDALFEFSKQQELPVFETSTSYYLPGPVCMFSKKEKEPKP